MSTSPPLTAIVWTWCGCCQVKCLQRIVNYKKGGPRTQKGDTCTLFGGLLCKPLMYSSVDWIKSSQMQLASFFFQRKEAICIKWITVFCVYREKTGIAGPIFGTGALPQSCNSLPSSTTIYLLHSYILFFSLSRRSKPCSYKTDQIVANQAPSFCSMLQDWPQIRPKTMEFVLARWPTKTETNWQKGQAKPWFSRSSLISLFLTYKVNLQSWAWCATKLLPLVW